MPAETGTAAPGSVSGTMRHSGHTRRAGDSRDIGRRSSVTRWRRDDAANPFTTLEAVIVCLLLLGAILFTMDVVLRPPSASPNQLLIDQLEWRHSRVGDQWTLLPAWNVTTREVDSDYGPALWDRILRLPFTDRDIADWEWDRLLQQYYGVYDAHRGNLIVQLDYRIPGQRDRPVLYNAQYGDPRGEAAAHDRLLTPQWGGVYTHGTMEPVDSVLPLTVETTFVNSNKLVRQPGDAIRVTARFDNSIAGSPTQAQAYGLVGQDRYTNPPTVNVEWRTIASVERPDHDGLHAVTAESPGTTLEFDLSISAHRDIAVGVQLHILAERPLETLQGDPDVNDDEGWRALPPRVYADGWEELVLERTAPIAAGESKVAAFRASVPLVPDQQTARVHAWLSNGALARSTAIVQLSYVDATDPSTPRQLFPTLPYALQEGALARVGAVLQNGPEDAVVEELVFDMPGGYDLMHHDMLGAPIFDTARAVTGVHPPGDSDCNSEAGNWTIVSAREVRWCGRVEVAAYGAATFLADVPIARAPTAFDREQQEYWNATLQFGANGLTARALDGPGAWRAAPGVYRFRVDPATATDPDGGYPHAAAGGGVIGLNDYSARLHRTRGGDVDGPTGAGPHYRAQATAPGLAQLEGAIRNATLEPAARVVRAGDSLRVDADYEALARELGALGNLVSNVRLQLDVFPPPSLPGKPFLSLTRDLEDTLPTRVVGFASADLSTITDHELVSASGDGRAYALSTGAGEWPTPPGATPWSADVAESVLGSTVAVAAGDVDPMASGLEAVAVASDGTVRMVDGENGFEAWSHALPGAGLAVAFDPLVENVLGQRAGRAYGLSAVGGKDPTFRAIDAASGVAVGSEVQFSGEASSGAIVPFAHPDGRAVAVAWDDGRVAAVSPDGVTVWWDVDMGMSGAVLAAAAADFYPGASGDEIAVAWTGGVALLSAETGGDLESWIAPRTGAAASMHATTLGGPAPEIAFAALAGDVWLLSMEAGAPSVELWHHNGFTVTTSAPKSLPSPEALPCTYEAGGLDESLSGLLYNLCTDPPQPPAAAAAVDLTPTAIRVVRDDSSAANPPLVVLGGTANARAYLVALDAATGVTLPWGDPAHIPHRLDEEVTALGLVARSDPAAAPHLAVGTDAGSVYLLEYATGASAWEVHVTVGTPIGRVAFYVDLPEHAIPGTYVATAALTWDRASVGKQAQAARTMTWWDVTHSDGTPVADPFVLNVGISAWFPTWDRGPTRPLGVGGGT